MNQKKLIVFTGGHHTSALLLAKALKNRGYSILWLGHKYSMAGDKSISAEYREVVNAKIPFISLKTGKVYRGSFVNWIYVLTATFRCLRLFMQKRPRLIVSFGGYLAVPPVLAGFLLKIPSISHEQTTVLGLANRFLLRFVKKMYLTWPIPTYARNPKLQLIGLPLTIPKGSQISLSRLIKTKLNKDPFLNQQKPTLLVMGGKQGSHFINKLIESNLEVLLESWNLIHQTGNNQRTQDFNRLKTLKKYLIAKQKRGYILIDYSSDLPLFMQKADMIVSRSGAHAVFLILYFRKKCLAIPYPYSYKNEQFQNAKMASKSGLIHILNQDKADKITFLNELESLKNKKISSKKVDHFVRSHLIEDALKKLVCEIEALIA